MKSAILQSILIEPPTSIWKIKEPIDIETIPTDATLVKFPISFRVSAKSYLVITSFKSQQRSILTVELKF